MQIIETLTLIYADVDHNNNKWWKGEVRDDNSVRCSWDRVGGKGQEIIKNFGSLAKAQAFLKSKSNEKIKKGYKKLDVLDGVEVKASSSGGSLQDIAKRDLVAGLSPDIAKLIERLVRTNVHNVLSQTTLKYDEKTMKFSTPLGVVSRASVDEARKLLNRISQKDGNHSDLVSDYMKLIPMDLGRKRLGSWVLSSDNDIARQNDVLDSIIESIDDFEHRAVAPVDEPSAPPPKLFKASMEIIVDQKLEQRLFDKFYETRQSMHTCYNMKPTRAYRITIDEMSKAFNEKGKKLGNIMELWHGTRVSNILSILKHGLVIPPSSASHVCGRLFGNGLYFSDQSTKSLNYCTGFWGGSTDGGNCYMFIADVAMGKYYHPSHQISKCPDGYDSIFAQGGKSGVMNNEMIVPNTYQANIMYMVEFSR